MADSMPDLGALGSPALSYISSPEARAFRTLDELREATDSPSPLTGILQDPLTLRSLLGGHTSTHKKTRRPSLTGTRKDSHSSSTSSSSTTTTRKKDRSHGKDKDRTRDRDRDTASLLTIVLAEEERQAHHLKALLRTTAERLEMEMRRGDQAERRAFTAESQARETSSRHSLAENSKHQAELDTAHARSEITKYKIQAESFERELKKAENELMRVNRQKEDLERSLAEAKDSSRKAQQALREWQAREEGREEGRRSEAIRRYNDGRDDGYEDGKNEGYETGHAEGYDEGHVDGLAAGRQEGQNAGRLAGFEEGKTVGYNEGYNEGLERGRKEERENALKAFDKFIDKELEKRSMTSTSSDDDEPDRTQEWVEATTRQIRPPTGGSHRSAREPSPQPLRVPHQARGASPQPVRGPSPQPVPVAWLHRRPNPNGQGGLPPRAVTPHGVPEDR